MKQPFRKNGLRYCYDSNGEKQCTGAQMGRLSHVPSDYEGRKLRLARVRLSEGYDAGGAYWGTPSNLWCAYGETEGEQFAVYVRAESITGAMVQIHAFFRERGARLPMFRNRDTFANSH